MAPSTSSYRYPLPLVRIHFVHVAVDRRGHGHQVLRHHDRDSADAHRQRTEDQKESDNGGHDGKRQAASAGGAQQCRSLLHQRLNQADQRHLAIQHCIANGHSRLSGENLDHLLLRLIEKVRLAALVDQHADASLVVVQRHRVHCAVARLFKMVQDLRRQAGFLVGIFTLVPQQCMASGWEER